MTVADPTQQTNDIEISLEGATGVITLTREKALNALSGSMRAQISDALPKFASDPLVYAVVLRSTSPKAFCAGGDVRQVASLGQKDRDAAQDFFAGEYRLIWQLECFVKPTVSMIDGIVMGSGVGLSIFGTHRLAGPKYKFAMPETAIGFFPDVGVAHVLSRLPDEIGLYLGLSGHTIGRSDAYALGLATHALSSEAFETVAAELADAQPVDPLVDGLHQDPGPSELVDRGPLIRHCFSAVSPVEILKRLSAVSEEDKDWAQGVMETLEARAPLAVAVTLEFLRQARDWDLRQTLIMDYRLACQFLAETDFYEGVRAVLVDKDNQPGWQPASHDSVTDAQVAAYFASRGDKDLNLLTRDQMQEVR